SQLPLDAAPNKIAKGHAHIPGHNKDLNDLIETITKQGASQRRPWFSEQALLPVSLPPTQFASICATPKATAASDTINHPPDSLSVEPTFTDNDLIASLTDGPDAHPVPSDVSDVSDLPALPRVPSLLQKVKGILTGVSEAHLSPALNIPRKQRGVRLAHAHDILPAGHESTKTNTHMTHQYRADLHAHLRKTSVFTEKRLKETTEGRKADHDQQTSHVEPQVSNKVWRYRFAQHTRHGTRPEKRTRKLLPRGTEPHMITNKLSPVVYPIRVNQGRKGPLFRWVHRNQIQLHQTPMGLAGDHTISSSN
ncbi:MAG: hypothetical protein AAGJ80_15605, partial [Cyanobacteria bacterium J06553_1]